MMEKDFNAEKFSNITQNVHILKGSMIAEMTDTVKQRAQSMIVVVS